MTVAKRRNIAFWRRLQPVSAQTVLTWRRSVLLDHLQSLGSPKLSADKSERNEFSKLKLSTAVPTLVFNQSGSLSVKSTPDGSLTGSVYKFAAVCVANSWNVFLFLSETSTFILIFYASSNQNRLNGNSILE